MRLSRKVFNMDSKIVFTILFSMFFILQSFAQSNGLNFQGVARNASGVILASQKIGLKFSIINGSETGNVEYVETRIVNTNPQGIFSVVIGDTGAVSTIGIFANINWKTNAKFLKVEMDPAGGSSFVNMGTTQLQKVPYAYYANGVNAANIDGTLPIVSGGTGVTSMASLKSSLGVDQINNTSDLSKPISTATQAALDLKANASELASKANVADLAGKAPIASPTFTGTVGGITKSMVGLSNVDNTTDLQKPLSNATVNALSLKATATEVTASLLLKENISNKSTSILLGTSDELYPTQKAVKGYVDAQINAGGVADNGITNIKIADGAINNDKVSSTANIAFSKLNITKSNITNLGIPAVEDVVSASTYSSTISQKENTSNKSTDTTLGGNSASNTSYPSQLAVKNYVDNHSMSSLNGLTGSIQSFSVGAAGNSPAFVSASSTHTLNIPMASLPSVSAGLIAKTDFDKFFNKSDFSGDYNELSNKPIIPAAPVQANWLQTDNTKLDFIKFKPLFAEVATSGNFDDLTNKPTLTSLGAVPSSRKITINGVGLDLTADRTYEISTTVNTISLQSNVTGVLPIANGGTGSSTKSYVDLTTPQTVQGAKKFNDPISVGTSTPNATAIVDINSTTKGFLPPRMNTAQRDAIANPAIGLTIFNTETNCLEWWIGTIWYNACGNAPVSITTNGTGAVVINNCATGDGNNLLPNTAANPYMTYQMLNVTVTQAGSYTFIAKNNGITFSAVDKFDSYMVGTTRDVYLRATGTPTNPGTDTYVLTTSPSCSFTRTVNTTSSNGTSTIASWVSGVTAAGSMMQNKEVSGVTQTLTATVTTPGTYNIHAESNGVSFDKSGTFASTGNYNIVLTASGTPTNSGTFTFTTNTDPEKSFTRTILSPTSNGTAVVNSWTDGNNSVGDLFVYTNITGVTHTIVADVTTVGTYTVTATLNGIQFAGSGTFTGTGNQNVLLTATGLPTTEGNNIFTLNTVPSLNFARMVQANASSSGTAVVSNWDCSTGSRGNMIVNSTIYNTTQTLTANVTRAGTYFINTVKNGITFTGSGTFAGTGSQTVVLTASGVPTTTGTNSFDLTVTPGCSFNRSVSVHPSSNGTAVIDDYIANSPVGTITVNAAVSGISQYITANVTTPGTYSISTTQNGITFAASGTFTNTGSKSITLVATGTPVATAINTFTLNTSPNVSFNRTILAQPSSNGTAIVNSWTTGITKGIMYVSIPVSDLTQTLTANVATAGTYSISRTVNGVTFVGSGTFAGTGSQTVELFATGTPLTIANNSFTINTTPSSTFTITSKSYSSNGTAIISGYTNGTSTGNMYLGQTVNNVSQTIVANVTTAGTYSLEAKLNGVSFTATGTFTNTGSKTITLSASGTPEESGVFQYRINTNPNVAFNFTSVSSTSNGTALISNLRLGNANGDILVNTQSTSVSQEIIVNVDRIGTYDISTSSNGVTFSGSGTLNSTGEKTITLTGSGIPIGTGSITFNLNTNPSLQFTKDILVRIGNQLWTSRNLDVSNYANGDPIPLETNNYTWSQIQWSSRPDAYCYYGNDPNLGAVYGKLYNWSAVTDPRGLAPAGYHVPSIEEWKTLMNFLGGQANAGAKIKEVGYTHWLPPVDSNIATNSISTDNSSGFTALPGGYRNLSGGFGSINGFGYFWSSSIGNNSDDAQHISLDHNRSRFGIFDAKISVGFSVRLIKNQ